MSELLGAAVFATLAVAVFMVLLENSDAGQGLPSEGGMMTNPLEGRPNWLSPCAAMR